MERFLGLLLKTVLFIVAYSVMSHMVTVKPPSIITPTIRTFLHKEKSILRQGISVDDAAPDKTEAPPKRECVCSKIYDPVCASNNESYFNLCYLECKVPKTDNVTIIHQGNCIPF